MSSKKSKDERLPDGWVLCCSKSNQGRKYYFNKKTGKSSWTQPEASGTDKKMNKKERNKAMEKKRKEELNKKGNKRKSDGDAAQSSKRKKHDSNPSKNHQLLYKHKEKSQTVTSAIESQTKSQNHRSTKSTPTKAAETSKKLKKNLANARLSQLRTRLSNEAEAEESLSLSPTKKRKASPNETPSKHKNDKSPLNDSKSNQSPNESLHSIPSPSQFFAANKIISSMKAQLPEEYCNKDKQKDTFADIEKGICSQTPEYPFSKHPATPPQFSEASKLVSAIKSKLAYKVSTQKDSKTFVSAKDRMEALRVNLSSDLDSNCSFNATSESVFNNSQLNSTCSSEAMEIEDFREVRQTSPNRVSSENNVVLVVDTNIFIHELDIIKDVLNSHLKGYTEQPTLLVPWRVINELDRLKDNNNGNGAVCKRAKAAMDYLYKSLPENSRIKGQPLRDANSHIYPCEIPDDEILNCSLQQVERGKKVLLVSNDKNLRNKAQINSVQHIGIKELRDMLENKPQPAAAELFAAFIRLRDAIYPLLANILENEMRAKYDNLWQYVLFKAPPWTLDDVLQCLLKHWIAVFNEVFPRIEQLITDLKRSLTSLQKKDPKTVTQSEVTTFKELCLDVARRCQIIPEYMQLAKTCVERLLRDGASETEDRVGVSASEMAGRQSGSGMGDRGMRNSTGASETNVFDSNRSTDRVEVKSVSGMGDTGSVGGRETGDARDPRTEVVVEAFERLWTVCSSYCAKLATSAGVAHTIEDRIPGDECLQSLTDKWYLFTGNIDAIARAIHGVTMADDLSMDEALNNFERTFKEAIISLCIDKTVARHELRIFCIKCRDMLQEASNKFSQLSDLLVICKDRLSN